jgi:hypothetical protein
MDPDTRRLMLFAGGLAGVLICLIGASTLLNHRSDTVPVVSADPRPIRVKPDNPGGMQINGAENDVFSGGVDNGNSKLAAVAETPDPNGLKTAAAAASPPPKPSITVPAATQAATQPAIVTAPARPTVVASAAPLKPTQAAPAKPPAVTAATASASHAAVAPASGTTTAGRAAMVQLAAVGSEQAARDEWQHLAKRMPELLNGREPNVLRVERDGHTYWRLRTTGFSDATQARAFCERMRAKGGGCAVADF